MGSRGKLVFSLLSVVVSLGLGVRVFWLDRSPATVNWDEAALGYNAYSLVKTGRDEFGKALPVSLRSFDDYKPAVYSYLAAVPIAMFDLGEVTTRLPSAIFGTLAIYIVYYLGVKLSRDRIVGLVAGVIVAVSPWAVHFSRIAFEANVAMVMYLAAVALLVRRDRYWAVVMAVVAMYTYHASRAIALPTLLLVGWYLKVRPNWKHVAVAGVLLVPLGINYLTEPIGARLAATNIFKLWPFVPMGNSWWLVNPIYSLLWMVSGHYLAYLSPATLFWRGSTEPILRIPGVGLFVPELLPLWLIGWWNLKRYRQLLVVTLILAIVAPLPAVVTWNWFSVVRSLAIYPVWAWVMGVGAATLVHKNKLVAGIVVLMLIPGTIYGLATTVLYYPVETSGEFQPGFEQSAADLVALEPTVDRIIVDSPQIAPYIFILFYGQYPPLRYQHSFGKWEFRKITPQDLAMTNSVIMGSDSALPGYETNKLVENQTAKKVTEYKDTFGYTSFRMVQLF